MRAEREGETVIEEKYPVVPDRLPPRARSEAVAEKIVPLRPLDLPEGALVRWLTGRTSGALTVAGWAMFGVLVIAAIGQLFSSVEWQNEGELLTYPWLMLRGYVPYRDIWMMYPPGVFALLAALMKIGVPPLIAVRGLSFVARIAYVLLVNRAFTNSWRRVSWIGVLMTFSLVFLGIPARPSPYVLGAPLLFLALVAARDHLRLSVALFLIAGLFRFELGLVGLACLTGLALFRWGNGEDGRSALLSACALLGGSGAAYGALNLLTGGKALPEIFLLPVMVVNPNRRVPLFPPQCGPLGIPLELTLLIVPMVVLILTIKLRRPYLAATNLGVLCLLPHLLQHANWEHLFITSAMVLPWNLLTLTSLSHRSVDQVGSLPAEDDGSWIAGPRTLRAIRVTTRVSWITAAIWPGLLVLGLVLYFSSLSPLSYFHGWDDVATVQGRSVIAYSPSEAHADARVARFLDQHAAPNDRLFVSQGTLVHIQTNPVFMYYLSGMQPANSHLELNPGLEDTAPIQRQIIGSLHRGTWIVEWVARLGTEHGLAARRGSRLFQRWVHSHARLMLSNRYYRVLRVV